MVQNPEDSEGIAVVTDLSAVREARKQPKPTERRIANRRFDTEKVERLKRAIEQGHYSIDPFSTADRFIEHERNGH